MAVCITCEEEYSNKRLDLGYLTCLDCGQVEAVGIINARNKKVLAEIAPAAAAAGELELEAERNDWDSDPSPNPDAQNDEDT